MLCKAALGRNSKPQKGKVFFFFSFPLQRFTRTTHLVVAIKIGGTTTTRKDRISDPKGLRRSFILPFRELPPSFVAWTVEKKKKKVGQARSRWSQQEKKSYRGDGFQPKWWHRDQIR